MSAGKEQKKINTKDTCASTSSSSFVMRFALAVVMSLTCSSATTVRADFVAAVTPFFPKKKKEWQSQSKRARPFVASEHEMGEACQA